MQSLLSSYTNRRKDALGALRVFRLFVRQEDGLVYGGTSGTSWLLGLLDRTPPPALLERPRRSKTCASAPGCRPQRRHLAGGCGRGLPPSVKHHTMNVWNPQLGAPNSGSMSGNGFSRSNMPNRPFSQSRCTVTAFEKDLPYTLLPFSLQGRARTGCRHCLLCRLWWWWRWWK